MLAVFVCCVTAVASLVQSPVPFAFPNPAFLNDIDHVTIVVPPGFSDSVSRIEVYTVGGVYVRRLDKYHMHDGEKHFYWDGVDNEDLDVQSGVYIAYVIFDETERNTAFLFRVQR